MATPKRDREALIIAVAEKMSDAAYKLGAQPEDTVGFRRIQRRYWRYRMLFSRVIAKD